MSIWTYFVIICSRLIIHCDGEPLKNLLSSEVLPSTFTPGFCGGVNDHDKTEIIL